MTEKVAVTVMVCVPEVEEWCRYGSDRGGGP